MLPNKLFLQPSNEGGEIVTGEEDAAADVFTMIYHQLLVQIKTSPHKLCHCVMGRKLLAGF